MKILKMCHMITDRGVIIFGQQQWRTVSEPVSEWLKLAEFSEEIIVIFKGE